MTGQIQLKCRPCATSSAFIAVAASLTLASVDTKAAEPVSCEGITGTYVTTITDREGVFASRGVITFAAGGIILVSDSAQGGVPGVWEPFSNGQGEWQCLGAEGDSKNLSAVALNFVLPKDGSSPSFGRVDYKITIDPKKGTMEGSAALMLKPGGDIEAEDPLNEPGKVIDEFHLDGVKLTAGK